MLTLKNIKRALTILATVVTVALVVIEKFEEAQKG
jgi:hypothetical protein